jgi:hypothetical protein
MPIDPFANLPVNPGMNPDAFKPNIPRNNSEKKKSPSRGKQAFFWFMALVFICGFALTLSEVILRNVNGQWSNTFFHRYDPVLGTWHIESHSGDYVQEDFEIRGIEINSFGMRDRERALEKGTGTVRIAVLGDSFTEAFHVKNDETFTRVLEKAQGGKIEVLNFGVAGFGTVQQLLTYREKVRQFKPDIVILAFLSANDMRNNSRVLEDLYTGTTNTDRPFPERVGGSGEWTIVAPTPKPSATHPVILFIKKHFATYRFLWYAKGMFAARFSVVPTEGMASTTIATRAEPQKENASAYIARLFTPTHEEPFASAWDATEWAIRELRREVEADGGKFVLVTLPDNLKMERDPKAALEKEYGAELPKEFDIDYPERRLAAFSKREGIMFYDLTAGFRAERDRLNLEPPYFSYQHDGHWNPKGHALAAQLIGNYLERVGLIPKNP